MGGGRLREVVAHGGSTVLGTRATVKQLRAVFIQQKIVHYELSLLRLRVGGD